MTLTMRPTGLDHKTAIKDATVVIDLDDFRQCGTSPFSATRSRQSRRSPTARSHP
jgi:hypothetical protein